jgi:hypothetical protein
VARNLVIPNSKHQSSGDALFFFKRCTFGNSFSALEKNAFFPEKKIACPLPSPLWNTHSLCEPTSSQSKRHSTIAVPTFIPRCRCRYMYPIPLRIPLAPSPVSLPEPLSRPVPRPQSATGDEVPPESTAWARTTANTRAWNSCMTVKNLRTPSYRQHS